MTNKKTCYTSHDKTAGFDSFMELTDGTSARSCSNCGRTQVANGWYFGTFARERWTDVYVINKTIAKKHVEMPNDKDKDLSMAYDRMFSEVSFAVKAAMVLQSVIIISLVSVMVSK